MGENRSVGSIIKERRKQLKISAEELASKIGVSNSTVYRYENGDIEKVSIENIEQIAKALNTNPAYIMGWTKDASSMNINQSHSFNESSGGQNQISNYDGSNSTYHFGNSDAHNSTMQRLGSADLKLQRSLLNKIDEQIAIQRETNNKLDLLIDLISELLSK